MTYRTALFSVLLFASPLAWPQASPNAPAPAQRTTIFAGSTVPNPSYERVSQHDTGHAEAVRLTYDVRKISYAQLLEIFWRNIDPFDAGGQFCDRGDSYRAEIFYGNAEELQLAEASRAAVQKRFGKPIATRITAAAAFYPAEQYHQDYHLKNPLRYKFYRSGCGRDSRLEAVWGREARARQP